MIWIFPLETITAFTELHLRLAKLSNVLNSCFVFPAPGKMKRSNHDLDDNEDTVEGKKKRRSEKEFNRKK